MRAVLPALAGLLGAAVPAGASPVADRDAWPRTFQDEWRWIEYTTDSGLPTDRILGLVETGAGTLWAKTVTGFAWFDGYRWHGIGRPVPKSRLGDDEFVAGHGDAFLVVNEHRLFRGTRDGFEPVEIDHEGRPLVVHAAVPFGEREYLVHGRGSEAGNLFVSGPGGTRVVPSTTVSTRLHRTAAGDVVVSSHGRVMVWETDRFVRWTDFCVGDLRAGAWGGMLWRMDREGERGLWSWEGRFPPRLERVGDDMSSHVVAMDLNDSGRAIACFGDGRAAVRVNGAWERLRPVPTPLISPTALLLEESGDLWVGTDRGLFLHRGSSSRWRRYVPDEAGPATEANALLRDSSGDLWVGTGDGLVVYGPEGVRNRITSIDGTRLGVVTGLAEDGEGAIWVTSGLSFTGAFRRAGETWRRFGAADGLLAPHVHAVRLDARGRPWLLGLSATQGIDEPGAFRFDGETFRPWGDAEPLENRRVYAFVEDARGRTWFGTHVGISRWDGTTWTHWDDDSGLRRIRVFTLDDAPDGRVWFAHQDSNGIGFIDSNDDVHYLAEAVGLVNERVMDLRIDESGTLWFTTQGGLGRFDGERAAWFGRETGLYHTRLWPVLPEAGRVLVGTAGGGVYELDEAESLLPAPRVVLDPPVVEGARGLFRWRVFAYRGARPASSIDTRFRIDDGPWSPWTTARETVSSTLDPGRGAFAVEARGLFGAVTPAPATVSFSVTPPLHRHPVFLAAVGVWIVGMVGIAVAVYRRQQRQTRSVRRLAEEQRLLLTELNHRVRNNLASLVSLIDMTERNVDDVAQFAASMRSRTQAMAAVHTVLSRRQWRPVPLDELIESLTTPIVDGRLRLDGPDVPVSARRVQAVGMVVNELLINSLKHGALGAERGAVTVSWTAGPRTGDGQRVSLTWTERGGPPIDRIPVPGLGMGLIRGLVGAELGGTSDVRYPRDGAEHRLTIVTWLPSDDADADRGNGVASAEANASTRRGHGTSGERL